MTIKKQLYTYIENSYKDNKPILLPELYEAFHNVKKGTIRENMRRFILEEKLIKIKNGVYSLPDPNRILKTPIFDTEETINKKYILNEDGSMIGYRSGFYIANSLRLTTQTPSIILIMISAGIDILLSLLFLLALSDLIILLRLFIIITIPFIIACKLST